MNTIEIDKQKTAKIAIALVLSVAVLVTLGVKALIALDNMIDGEDESIVIESQLER